MVQKLAAIILAVLLGFTFGSGAFAQAPKKEVKKEVQKETKPAVTQDVKKDVKKDATKPAKPATMKTVSCGQAGCGFWAKSRSGKELRYIMKRHAKRYHKVELADKQLKDMVKKEGAK